MMKKQLVICLIPAALLFFLGGLSLSKAANGYAPSSLPALNNIGSIKLPYGEASKTVNIDDASPDIGSTNQGETDRDSSRWGMISALSVSGMQLAASPAAAYTSVDQGNPIEHITSVASNGHLIVYFWSPKNEWKAVDVTEKTGRLAAVEQPTAWTAQAGSVLLENVAARTPDGYMIVHTWQTGSDWVANNLTNLLGNYAAGAPTSWNGMAGSTVVEHVAFRNTQNDLIIFWSYAGGGWAAVNVSNITGIHIASDPVGWNMASDHSTDHIAALDANNHLILFTWTGTTDWTAEDVTSKIGNRLFAGRVAAWDVNGSQRLALKDADAHLIVLTYDTIDRTWLTTDVTTLTGWQVSASPSVYVGGSSVNLFAPGPGGEIVHFFSSGGSSWAAENISALNGVKIFTPLAAWTSTDMFSFFRIAGPSADGHLQVITYSLLSPWFVRDVSLYSAGRVVYGASPSGVWVSRDYGVTWSQSTRPQPAPKDNQVAGALLSRTILDVAVSQADPNVAFAVTDLDTHIDSASGAGLYRTEDGGLSWQLMYQSTCSDMVDGVRKFHIEGISQVIFAPDDPQRVYAAAGCQILMTPDGGKHWKAIKPVGWNDKYPAWHLAVTAKRTEFATSRSIVACGNGQLWVSNDEGGTWAQDLGTISQLPWSFCGKTARDYGNGSRLLALAPSDPGVVYIAYPDFANSPSYYHPQSGGDGPDGVFCNWPLIYDANDNHVFDPGDWVYSGQAPKPGDAVGKGPSLLDAPKLKYRDDNGNNQLDKNENVAYDVNDSNTYNDKEDWYKKAAADLQDGQALQYDSKLRVLDQGRTFGARGCGGASLWQGNISGLIAGKSGAKGTYQQVRTQPTLYNANTASGSAFVATTPQPDGSYLVIFSDLQTVALAVGGNIGSDSWYRLDGPQISEDHLAGRNGALNFMHVDPHSVAISPGFRLKLKPVTDQSFPYNQDQELDTCYGGRIWLTNDGGVYGSDDCGKTKDRWTSGYSGLHTLILINIAGVPGIDGQPGLYFGTGDNDDFFSLNGGRTWKTTLVNCGDCDAWFSDPFMPNRVLVYEPRTNEPPGSVGIFTAPTPHAPDAASSAEHSVRKNQEGMRYYAISDKVHFGNRPIVLSLPNATPLTDGDYIFIQKLAANQQIVLRTTNFSGSSNYQQSGPQIPTLPAGAVPPDRPLWVQASSGSENPDYFLGDGVHLWKTKADGTTWQELRPDPKFNLFKRHFVNPYNANQIYALTDNGIFRSDTGGATWDLDVELNAALSASQTFKNQCGEVDCILNDMVFEPVAPFRRFAAGVAGVFFSVDSQHWFRLLDTRAIPSLPVGLWFDFQSNNSDDALYVANAGRGLLRLHPIPRENPYGLPPVATPTPTPAPTPTPTPPGSGKDELKNGSFEAGLAGWQASGYVKVVQNMVFDGQWGLQIGQVEGSLDEISQSFNLPCDARRINLNYEWYLVSTNVSPGKTHIEIMVDTPSGSLLLQSLNELDAQSRWQLASYDLTPYACQPVTLRIRARQPADGVTTLFLDAVHLLSFNGKFFIYLPQVMLK